MTTKADFQRLADIRAREAKLLLDAGEWDGAFYLAGYAVECGLKACIIKRLNLSDVWPEKRFMEKCYQHDLKLLLQLAGLDAVLASAGTVAVRWGTVKDWDESSRYEYGKTEVVVRQFYEAITNVTDGVLPWIKANW